MNMAIPKRVLVFAVACSLSISTVHAQKEKHVPNGKHVSVLVAVVDSLPLAHGVQIIRAKQGPYRNMIVMPRALATKGQLAAAAGALAGVMANEGDFSSKEVRMRIPEDAIGPSSALGAARNALSRIESSKEKQIPQIGRARVTEIYLPDQSLRDEISRKGVMRFRKQN